MNWDNQNNQDPWGRKDQDEVSFDDLIKKFSVMFEKQGSGSNGSSGGSGFNFPTKKAFFVWFFWATSYLCEHVHIPVGFS